LNCGEMRPRARRLKILTILDFPQALANIVKVRQSKGFQLLVISHDDDFIEKLARETSAESYYR
jgi:hypothetical protein